MRYLALISCQPGVITVSVAEGGIATPGAIKQLLPPDRVFKRIVCIYMRKYTLNQLKAETTLDVHLRF